MSREEIERLIADYGAERVFAAVRPLLSDERLARIDDVLRKRLQSLTVVVENLYDPHNGAAAIRSIEAFGLTELWAVEAANAFPVSGDVTIGADKWIDIVRQPDAAGCAATLRAKGFRIAATTPDAAIAFTELPMDSPWAIWFGNERDGLSEEAIGLADERVAIPMHGFTRSFNISVSVALVIAALSARRRVHLGCDGDLDEQKMAALRARFAATGIRGLSAIVARHVSD